MSEFEAEVNEYKTTDASRYDLLESLAYAVSKREEGNRSGTFDDDDRTIVAIELDPMQFLIEFIERGDGERVIWNTEVYQYDRQVTNTGDLWHLLLNSAIVNVVHNLDWSYEMRQKSGINYVTVRGFPYAYKDEDLLTATISAFVDALL